MALVRSRRRNVARDFCQDMKGAAPLRLVVVHMNGLQGHGELMPR